MLKATTEKFSTVPSKQSSTRPQSPSSVRGILYPIPNVCPSLRRTFDATKSLFSNPLSNVPDQISSKGKVLLTLSYFERTEELLEKVVYRVSSDLQFCTDSSTFQISFYLAFRTMSDARLPHTVVSVVTRHLVSFGTMKKRKKKVPTFYQRLTMIAIIMPIYLLHLVWRTVVNGF